MSGHNCPECFFLNPRDATVCSRCQAPLRPATAARYMADIEIADRYILVQSIGAGGMGEVWLAIQNGLERRVAIKFLHSDLMRHPTARQRVLNEGRALGRITHKNVVNIYECFETADTVALVLEYIDGGSLAQRIQSGGALSWTESASLVVGVLEGLDEIHGHDLVHRDIKPDNILLAGTSEMMTPKITDLGIVHDQSGERLTQIGGRLGTPEYMSPEQIRGQSIDCRTDIYAVGVMLYEMLTGSMPFTGSDYDIQHGHVSISPDLSCLPDSIPDALSLAVATALAKKPEDRYPDALSMIHAMKVALDMPQNTVNPEPNSGKKGSSESDQFVRASLALFRRDPTNQEAFQLAEEFLISTGRLDALTELYLDCIESSGNIEDRLHLHERLSLVFEANNQPEEAYTVILEALHMSGDYARFGQELARLSALRNERSPE